MHPLSFRGSTPSLGTLSIFGAARSKMQQGKPSQTAIASAIFRAAHQILDGEPRILDDPLSVGLVPGSSRDEIAAQAARLNAAGMKPFRINFVLRNRSTEDSLHDAVQAGVMQCVLLGAGLDTFAYRQLGWARQLKIFEVDHPAAQAWKQDLLRNSRLQLPGNLFFVPCDFETTTLREALASTSIDDPTPGILLLARSDPVSDKRSNRCDPALRFFLFPEGPGSSLRNLFHWTLSAARFGTRWRTPLAQRLGSASRGSRSCGRTNGTGGLHSLDSLGCFI